MVESTAAEPELAYHPVLGDLDDLIVPEVTSVLIVDGAVPTTLNFGAVSVRTTHPDGPPLPTGIYRFVADSGVALMAVDSASLPGAPASCSWEAPDEHPLIQSYGWFAAWWEAAEPVPPPRFSVNAPVIARNDGREGVVRKRRFRGGKWMYSVRLGSSTKELVESQLDEPIDAGDPESWISRAPGSAKHFAATLTRAKLAQQLTDTVYSFRATRTIFRPYQFRPVMRLLESGTYRLLIADEVGLGKTIEAGLVWTELDARSAADRVLVVCPSMLVPKWRAEMQERFGYELIELTKDGLDDLFERVSEDRLPRRYHAVCSVERLRVWSRLEQFAAWQPKLDLVIVDEAHVFRNMGTRSHALGGHLSDWAEAMIFLSATPLNLGNDDLYNLLTLLAPGEFDDRWNLEHQLEPNAVLHHLGSTFLDATVTAEQRLAILDGLAKLEYGKSVTLRPEYEELRELVARPAFNSDHRSVAEGRRLIARMHALSAVVTRTRKIQVQHDKAVREVHPIHVDWTPEEAEFYTVFDAWQRARAAALGAPGFAVQMPLRLASSCVPAARARVLDARVPADEDLDEIEHDVGVGLDAETRRRLMDIISVPPEVRAAAKAIPDDLDTKFAAFIGPLRDLTRDDHQVLVFTFSRRTLAYLSTRLRSEGFRIAELHGGVPADERHRIMADFRAGRYEIVLANRVASEGLDFEFCSAVVNYDLPWNPMEVEQRIGRIDRFGQQNDKVIIVNFVTPGTIETDIFQRLMDRIDVFTDSIGELEPILQSKLGDIRGALFNFDLSPEQRDAQLEATLTAAEETRLTEEDVQAAAAYLTAADNAEIDGLEDALVSEGRYIGQAELGLLMEDWVDLDTEGSKVDRTGDGRFLVLEGSSNLAEQLGTVRAKGERSAAELANIDRDLRTGMPQFLCLDQEHARRTGAQLLTANHPLVRAAVHVPGPAQTRYTCARIDGATVPSGTYVTLVAMAEWSGARPSCEFWTSSVPLDAPRLKPGDAVGAEVLRALTEARIGEAEIPVDAVLLERSLQTLLDDLDERRATEAERRKTINEALIAERRASLEQTHQRKVASIRKAIASLHANGNLGLVPAQEGRIRTQDHQFAQQLAELDRRRGGEMSLEYVAVAVISMS